jgi:UTP--glucose-1-phosphate uridylyltransferase
MPSLREQLALLDPEVRARLDQYHFDAERLITLGERLKRGEDDDGVIRGSVEPPLPGDVVELPDAGTPEYRELEALGEAALRESSVALVVLAGGMATRMGGVVKALVEALPGRTFLDLRLAELDALGRRFGKKPPLWLMTSDATDAKIRSALGSQLSGDEIATFTQYLSLRLLPNGELFLDEHGRPSEHAPGHGDLPDALKESGLLQRFVERGGKTLMITNLDNLGGALEPVVIGFHLSHGKPLTSEVGVDGVLRVLEEFRIPPSFDPSRVRVFNTNTFHVGARELLELHMDWRFFTVKKQVDGEPVIQFERIVNEITDKLPTQYLHMPRVGPMSRFLPVKDHEELERRRGEIELVARARGLL